MSPKGKNEGEIPRRRFLKLSAAGVGAAGTTRASTKSVGRSQNGARRSRGASLAGSREYEGTYSGDRLNRPAFPMGGIGAGMICLEGTGSLSHFSLRNRPEVFNELCVFAAVGIRGNPEAARLLEGPVPRWKLFNEYECGHWYARAMSSYALLQALSGARYDAVDKVLYLAPKIRGDFRCFLSTAAGYGTVDLRKGKPFFELRSGKVEIESFKLQAQA